MLQAERRALEESAETEGAAAGGDHDGPASPDELLMPDPTALAADVRLEKLGMVVVALVSCQAAALQLELLQDQAPCKCAGKLSRRFCWGKGHAPACWVA